MRTYLIPTTDGLGIVDVLPFLCPACLKRIGILDLRPIVFSITARNLSSLHLKKKEKLLKIYNLSDRYLMNQQIIVVQVWKFQCHLRIDQNID